jgi:hypothetical protein
MLAISEHCQDIETLMRAGQVAAWRSGLPHYRASALAHCPTLPPQALALALRSTDTTQTTDANALLAQLSQKRFAAASAPVLSIVGRLGGFTGYGGQFCAPPQLVRSAGALFAFDSNAVWELHADAFGSLLRRLESSTPPAADAPSKAFTLSATGRVQWAGGAHDFAEFAGATAWVCDDELLAVVPSRSHYIYLVAAQSGPTC